MTDAAALFFSAAALVAAVATLDYFVAPMPLRRRARKGPQ